MSYYVIRDTRYVNGTAEWQCIFSEKSFGFSGRRCRHRRWLNYTHTHMHLHIVQSCRQSLTLWRRGWENILPSIRSRNIIPPRWRIINVFGSSCICFAAAKSDSLRIKFVEPILLYYNTINRVLIGARTGFEIGCWGEGAEVRIHTGYRLARHSRMYSENHYQFNVDTPFSIIYTYVVKQEYTFRLTTYKPL